MLLVFHAAGMLRISKSSQMNVKSRLVKSSIARYIEVIVAMGTAIVLTPYLINQLGEANYGLWILILSTLGWFGFVDLGFSAAVQRQMTIFIEQNDQQSFNKLFSCALALFFILSIVATIGIFALGVFPQLLAVPEEKLTTTSIIISILCLKIFMDFLMNAFHGIFVGHVRFDIDANIGIITSLTKAVLVFVMVKDFGLYGVVWATVSADILNNILKVYSAKKLQQLRFSFADVDFDEIKQLFSFSKHIFLMIIGNTIRERTNPVIIAHYLDLPSITIFSIANRLATMTEQLVSSIAYVFGPIFYKQVANNAEPSKVQALLYTIVSLYAFFSAIFFIPLVVMSKDIVALWIGISYSDINILVAFLVLAFFERVISNPIGTLLVANAQHQKIAYLAVIVAFISITLSITLINISGLKGVVIASALSSLIAGVGLLWLLNVETAISPWPIVKTFTILTFLYASLFFLGDVILVQSNQTTWYSLLINSMLVFLVTLIFSWFLLLNIAAKQILLEQMNRLLEKVGVKSSFISKH